MQQFGDDVGHLRLDLEEVEADGDRVLALGAAHDTRDDAGYSQRLGWIFELEDGLIFRTRSYRTWDEARAAF